MNQEICVAIVRKEHGVKGEMKVTVLMDDANDFRKLSCLKWQNEAKFHKIERVFAVSDCFAIKLNGVNSVEDVQKIKGQKLFAKKEEVDKLKNENQIYIEDILNKMAVLDNGELLGKISDVQNFGANDIIYISSPKYKNLCFANIGGIIKVVDEEKNQVVLNASEYNKVSIYDGKDD